MSSLSDFDSLVRGAVDLTTAEDLRAKLRRGRPLIVKVGFDPTAPDIHLGHTVLMRKMKHFQDCGHRVVFVIGDFTALIGDPSGRSKTRPPLSPDQIAANAETYKRQAFKILDPERTESRQNSEWLSQLGAEGFIRLAARYNVARMLERRDFRQRYDAGRPISIHEFLYPLAQAYDSVVLRADIELGGTDQLFNLNVGRDIMPSYGLEPQVVLTTRLLEGTDGVHKMSKSLSNAIGITDSPDDMFAKVMALSDELMWRYYDLLTDLSPSMIEAEKRTQAPMVSKVGLARHLVGDFHGPATADAAETEWRGVHQERRRPGKIPIKQVAVRRYHAHELVALLGEAPSKGAAMRLVRQRAVKLDGQVVTPERLIEVRPGDNGVLSIGPRRWIRIDGQEAQDRS